MTVRLMAPQQLPVLLFILMVCELPIFQISLAEKTGALLRTKKHRKIEQQTSKLGPPQFPPGHPLFGRTGGGGLLAGIRRGGLNLRPAAAEEAEKKERKRREAVTEVSRLREEAQVKLDEAERLENAADADSPGLAGRTRTDASNTLREEAYELQKEALRVWADFDKAHDEDQRLRYGKDFGDQAHPREKPISPQNLNKIWAQNVPVNVPEAQDFLAALDRVSADKREQVSRRARQATFRLCAGEANATVMEENPCGLGPSRLRGLKGRLALATQNGFFSNVRARVLGKALTCASGELNRLRKRKAGSEEETEARAGVVRELQSCLLNELETGPDHRNPCAKVRACEVLSARSRLARQKRASMRSARRKRYSPLETCRILTCGAAGALVGDSEALGAAGRQQLDLIPEEAVGHDA